MAREHFFETGPTQSLLSRETILYEMRQGSVVIDPFNESQLNTVSYDVTLGSHYYRPNPNHGLRVYNPWNEDHVRRYWGEPYEAKTAWEEFRGDCHEFGLNANDRVIILQPKEMILGHTNEFIGGKGTVAPMMKARSSIGRNGDVVCKCAGWGDIGYTNRWTMEIESSLSIPSILIIGESVAQIVFFKTDPILGQDYTSGGKYQDTDDMDTIKSQWSPESMLPKLWKDRMKSK